VNILVLGAGRSAGFLIEFLGRTCLERGWNVTVCDRDFSRLKKSFEISSAVTLQSMDLLNHSDLESLMQVQHAVVSLLPPAMHLAVATMGVRMGIPVFTASYISEGMKGLDSLAKKNGVLLMNELGLDPGIDHLSANAILDRIRTENASLGVAEQWAIQSFESHCGGLVYAEDCTDNPWGYKFSWNPTNVVLAGQGGHSIFRRGGQRVEVSPKELFSLASTIDIPRIGVFDVYANRDSLGYSTIYGLDGAEHLLRGTLRRHGYCAAWQCLIDAGLTNNEFLLPAEVVSASLAFQAITGFENLANWWSYLLNKGVDAATLEKIKWLPIGNDAFWIENVESDCSWFGGKSAAQFLERLLLVCWKLEDTDRDEVVMFHRFVLENSAGEKKILTSSLQVIGEGGDRTAMAKTVGLPLALGLIAYLDGDRQEIGVQMPWGERWYNAILPALAKEGIVFVEDTSTA